MSGKIFVDIVNKGIRSDRTAFNIDNDSFPVLLNAYQWRGRVKRKRGTSTLGRLTRFFDSNSLSYTSTSTLTLSGGAANLITGFSLQTNASLVPGSITIIDTTASKTYTDDSMGNLVASGGTGTVNYATGAITISGGASDVIKASFQYYPDLPVLGLRELGVNIGISPGNLAFDTTYSYNMLNTYPYNIYNVTYYKNPEATSPYDYNGYVRKSLTTPFTWNSQNYQQMWTINYEGALWASNGLQLPFNPSTIGMQFKLITGVTIGTAGPPNATATLTITAHGLVVGDFVFINEVVGITGINFQTGYVIDVPDVDHVQIEFPAAALSGAYSSGGIAQYLTNTSDATKNTLRWYDGDPTNGSTTAPVLNKSLGWVNFAPPLSQGAIAFANAVSAQYYLVGARIIFPFKDRILFFGPIIQTSSATASPIYLQDTIIYSQNGTPYYTCSFEDSPDSITTKFTPILTPLNTTTSSVQTATASAYFCDQTGFGGYITFGLQQPITSVSMNEDVLIVGFSRQQARLVYTGNDVVPFNLYIINSELGSDATFASINLDRGVVSVGSHGIVITSQVSAQRIDLDIPDQIFQFNLTSAGSRQICSQRDFINEWMYFTYKDNELYSSFPNQTLLYNYRDHSWAIFNETYTTYGTFRKSTGQTWATLPVDLTWDSWNTPWNSGINTLLQPQVIGGTPQGFVMVREGGTDEGTSIYIQSFSGSQITSPNHCLNNGDYIIISNCLGTIGSVVNGNIYSVYNVDTNTFQLNPSIPSGSYTYLGAGVITRMYIPFIQTKQFPAAWEMGRKTRIAAQQYLFTKTDDGQIELQIYLSQDRSNPYNFGPVVPSDNVQNNSLVYTDVLYTCPESTNIGLTPANTNLQMPTANTQQQIWHRMNTSLIGDTVQIAFTMSDAQMRDPTFSNQFSEIEFHSMVLNISPSQLLA